MWQAILRRANAIQYEAYVKLLGSEIQAGGRAAWHDAQVELVAVCREAVMQLTPEVSFSPLNPHRASF